MTTPELSFADTFHDAHTTLLRDLQELEKAAASSSREAAAELRTRLGKLHMHLADHFRFEEEGGYMAPVLKEEPRFRGVIQELFAEHRQMAQALEALIQEVGTSPTLQHGSRQKIHAWVRQVRHHETRENNLVQEVYYSTGATGD
jgi:iron-sulfur cluster repair protein YtfE (RIC family)